MKVTLGDIEVSYHVSGEGPPVVLIHGLAEDHSSWAGVQQTLTDYRTYAIDLRGHGETSLGTPEGTLEQLGNDLARFLQIVTGPAACVGFSLGGTIVLWTAAAFPNLVTHPIAVGTSSIVGRAAVGFFESRIKMVQEDFSAFKAGLRDDTVAQLAVAKQQADTVTARRLAAVGSGGGYINAARAMIRMASNPLTPTLSRIDAFVDVIGGEHDAFCPRKAADIMLNALSHSTYQEVAASGHLMSVDNPNGYANAIKNALDGRNSRS